MFQPCHHSCRLLGKLVIRCILWYWGHFNCGFASIIYIFILLRGGYSVCDVFTFLDAYNYDPMSCLRYAVLLELIQVGREGVTSISHIIQYFSKSLAVVGISEPAYVFRKKPFRLELLKRCHAIRVEGAICTVHTFLFANHTVVIAGETKCKSVDRSQCVRIEHSYVFTDNAARTIGANIICIGIAGVLVVVRSPLVDNAILIVFNFCRCCSISDAARTAKQFPKSEFCHMFNSFEVIFLPRFKKIERELLHHS